MFTACCITWIFVYLLTACLFSNLWWTFLQLSNPHTLVWKQLWLDWPSPRHLKHNFDFLAYSHPLGTSITLNSLQVQIPCDLLHSLQIQYFVGGSDPIPWFCSPKKVWGVFHVLLLISCFLDNPLIVSIAFVWNSVSWITHSLKTYTDPILWFSYIY